MAAQVVLLVDIMELHLAVAAALVLLAKMVAMVHPAVLSYLVGKELKNEKFCVSQ
jgi:hypothetical protein